jgi:peptide deformylase
MAIRPVVLYPDPVLLKPTQPVARFDDGLRELLRDMADTMYAASGIGLAANQIGVPSRIFVMDISGGENPDALKVFVNPEITEERGHQVGDEGCLSFPDVTLDVERAQGVTVRAQDEEGRPFTFEAEGLLARAIQHECEHLDGQVFLRNISTLKRELVKKQIKKRIKAGDWLAAVAG